MFKNVLTAIGTGILSTVGGIQSLFKALLALAALTAVFYAIAKYTDSPFVNVIGAIIFSAIVIAVFAKALMAFMSPALKTTQTIISLFTALVFLVIVGGSFIYAFTCSEYTAKYAYLMGVTDKVVRSGVYNSIDPQNNSAEKEGKDAVSGNLDQQIQNLVLSLNDLKKNNADPAAIKAVQDNIDKLKKLKCENKSELCPDRISAVDSNTVPQHGYLKNFLAASGSSERLFEFKKPDSGEQVTGGEGVRLELIAYNPTTSITFAAGAAIVDEDDQILTPHLEFHKDGKVSPVKYSLATFATFRTRCFGNVIITDSNGKELTSMPIQASYTGDKHGDIPTPENPLKGITVAVKSPVFNTPADKIVFIRPQWSTKNKSYKNYNFRSQGSEEFYGCSDAVNLILLSVIPTEGP